MSEFSQTGATLSLINLPQRIPVIRSLDCSIFYGTSQWFYNVGIVAEVVDAHLLFMLILKGQNGGLILNENLTFFWI